MRITAKLAYSQLKGNCSRTVFSLIAIVLSTGLTTTICNFIASCNARMIDLLGADYGDYKVGFTSMLLIPVVLFGILIAAMSITVISNVFRVSARERIAQFGVLKCVGATQKQILSTVMYEGIFLSTVGIPLGVLLGHGITFVGIGVMNHFLDELNALANMMMKKIDFSIYYVFSWKMVAISILFSLVIVMYSAWKPAHKIARCPAISCIRDTDETKTDDRAYRSNHWVKKLFGFGGVLADKNLKRNSRNFRATMISLSVGVILFVSLGGLSGQANGIQNYMSNMIDHGSTMIADYISDYSQETSEITKRNKVTYYHPLYVDDSDRIKKKLQAFESMDIFSVGTDMDSYYVKASDKILDQNLQEELQNEKVHHGSYLGNSMYELPVEVIVMDSDNYAKLCKLANVQVGSNILLNHYQYNDNGYERDIMPLKENVESLELLDADDKTKNIKIDAVIKQKDIPKELRYPNTNPIRLVVQDAPVRGFSWECTPTDEEGFINFSNQVFKEEFGVTGNDSYMENGFVTRAYRTDDYVKVMNIVIVLATIFMYGFSILLMMIGLTNVISTLSTNVMMRAREFAVLKSVGMTSEGLRHMLTYEGILCSIKALFIGIPIGICITILINIPIRSMFPVPYKTPWIALAGCVILVFLISILTIRCALYYLRKQNIIETIRKV